MGDAIEQQRPKSRRVRTALAAGGSTIVGLLLAELCLRWWVAPTVLLDPASDAWWRASFRASPGLAADIEPDARLGWRMRRGFQAPGVTHDAAGHRVTPLSAPIDASRAPIVALGDSFTYGLGVRDEETWPARLAAALPGRAVSSLAANGHGLDQQVLAFEGEGVAQAPGLVILGYFLDDFRRNGLSFREGPKPRFVLDGGELRLEGEVVPSPDEAREELSETNEIGSYLVTGVRALVRRVEGRRGAFHSDAEFAAHAELSERLLERLAKDVRGSGAQLLVITIPHCSYEGYRDAARIESAIQSSCTKLGIPCLSTTDECRRAESAGVRMFGDNCHWSAAGHARIAEFVRARCPELGIRL